MKIRPVLNRLTCQMGRFHRDEGGAVAIMFGAMMVVFVLFLGGVIDFGAAMVARNRLGASADAASLSIAVSPQAMTDAERNLVGERYFKANYSEAAGVDVQYPDLQVNQHCDGGSQICVKSTKMMDTNLLRAADSVQQIPVGVESNVSGSAQLDLDTIIVMDASFSMTEDETGNNMGSTPLADQKITALKQAATSLVDILQTPQSANVRLGFAAYSTTLLEQNALDADAAANKNFIDTRVIPNAKTCGECGLVAAEQLLTTVTGSPRDDGAQYSPVKQLIFMTDGKQNIVYNQGDDNTDESRGIQAFTDRCTSLHSNYSSLIIYTIGFGNEANNGANRDALVNCASPDKNGGHLYYFAPTNDELQNVFKDIAKRMSKVRIIK